MRFSRVMAGLTLLAALLAIVVACRKDVIVEPPPPLNGDYTGTYTITQLINGRDSVIERPITWTFTDDAFLMFIDTAKIGTEDRVLCDVNGLYALSSGVELQPKDSSSYNTTRQTCNISLGPFGHFAVDQSKTNTVVLSGVQTKNEIQITRRIVLEKGQ